MENKNMQLVRRCIYVITFIVTCLPLACGYVMEGGDIHVWLARIEEMMESIKNGRFLLFPSAELTVEHSAQYSALNSNLWLLLPGLFRMVGMSITSMYRIYMLFMALISIFSAKRLFEAIFEDKITSAIAVLLYMTSPYRIYICYDKADLGMVVAWSLIPLLWFEVLCINEKRITWKRFFAIAFLVALVGYAHVNLLIISIPPVVLGCLWHRKLNVIFPIIAGGCLFAPGAIYWLRYVFKGGMGVWNFPLGSIVSKGYSVGQFFSGWTYAADNPGMGLGILGAMLVMLNYYFVKTNYSLSSRGKFYLMLLFFTGVASMKIFCWDMLQRLGAPFLRFVAIIETPGIMFGFTTLILAGFGARGVECIRQEENVFSRVGIPIIIIIASIGNAVYICNMLTYTRMPMFL